MTLAEWIKREGRSRVDVAKALEISPAYVTNLCSSTANWPGRDLMGRIRDLTGGSVTANDFLPAETSESETEAAA